MKIGGPFVDKDRRRSTKGYYLSYFSPKLTEQGTIIRNEQGKPVLQRHRPYFESKKAALAEKTRLLEQHNSSGIGPDGVLSQSAAVEYRRAKAIVGEISLVDVATFWKRHNPDQKRQTVAELRPLFLAVIEARKGRKHHFRDLKYRTGLFVKEFGSRDPESISKKEAVDWLLSKPGQAKEGRTLLNLKQSICNFYNWMIDEGYATHNPAGGIKRRNLPPVKRSEIKILTLDQVEKYLRACERYDPDIVASEIVQLFAGVRADDEMNNFDGKWINAETREIVVPAEIAKMERREVITEVEPVFWAWWKIYRRDGLLQPANYRYRWRRVRVLTAMEDREKADKLAQLSIRAMKATEEFKTLLKGWPWNARRRTFATYHVAKHQSADRTALLMRHRGDSNTLHNSYRGMGITQAQGIAYFELRPQPVRAPILPLFKESTDNQKRSTGSNVPDGTKSVL